MPEQRTTEDEVLEQPHVGGFCDDCGHFAARHDEQGCHFDRPDPKTDCDCRVLRWLDHDWPRPWLPAPDGLTHDTPAEPIPSGEGAER